MGEEYPFNKSIIIKKLPVLSGSFFIIIDLRRFICRMLATQPGKPIAIG
jgi:hypothetical protein